MKILAIRGKNLASLSAQFVVDFQSEPLASAGLYAITGSTGSGKSTLLDALCLALYERTPRLQKATAKGETIPDVGAATVSPSDPRTILRRGASEGFAEVDFVGNDGVAYRARWSARRARVKADGKLQASEISLLRIADSQPLGDNKKTETLRLIESHIGLSFEQFTRAVLLAQNDFATFLKAPDDERAELLQTLTGTETFAQISRQAYLRMKAESEALARLQSQLKDQQPLDASTRAETEAALQAEGSKALLLQSRKGAIEGHQRWHQQEAKLQQDLAEAHARHAAALAEQVAAQPRQLQLALLEQVQGARPLWAEQERLTHAVAANSHAQADATVRLAQALQQTQSCQAAFDAAQEQATRAEASRANAQAAIDQARALDAGIEALQPEHQLAAKAQADAQAHWDAQDAQQRQVAASTEQAQAELLRVEDWLQQHAPLRPLAEGWQGWALLFGSAQAALEGQADNQAEASALVQQAASNAQQIATAQSALEQANAQAHAASAQLQDLVQACAAVDADGMAHRKQALALQRDHLHAGALLWHKRSEVRAQRIRLQDQLQTHHASLAQSQAVLVECARSHPVCSGALLSAEQALQLAQLAASHDAQTMRGQLQPEQACPVCGSQAHPYADHAPALSAMLQGLQAHVAKCRQALQEVQERTAMATANQANAAKSLELGSHALAQLAAQRDALLQEWSTLALQAELDSVPEAQRLDWLQEHQEQARQALAALADQEAQHRQNLKRKDAAQQAMNAATHVLEQARSAQLQLGNQAAQISQLQDSTERKRLELAQQLGSTLAQLNAAFGDTAWQASWRAAPQAFAAQCHGDAKAWAQQLDSHKRLTQNLAELQLQQAAAHSACAQAALQCGTQSERLKAAQTKLQGFRDQRANLLEGRAVAEVEASLNAAIAQGKSGLAAARSSLQAAQELAARQQESQRLSAQQADQLRTELGAAQAALALWLERDHVQGDHVQRQGPQPAQRLDLDELQQLLAIEPAWIAQERQALQALHSGEASTRAVRDTRSQSLAEHEAARATSDSAEALQEQLLAVNAEAAALAATVTALQLEIARDDDRLAASGALRIQIEQQASTARVWSQLGELIGSADGKKFRNFAQQLTLDILLGYGNSHLQSLSKRYRLKRIEDSLGLLVVDQDMGDEVRSVHSLSGGESFLVSLAMALGLASLSSHRVRVESLFIDEGFGSLDADSLRVAMDALDSLQSLGRKVGVISHVQEMTERIGTRVQVQRQAGGLSRIVVG